MPERPQLHRSCTFTHPSRTFLQVKTLHPTNISSTQKDPPPNKRCRIYLQRTLNLNSDHKLAGVFALIISASSAPIFRNLCGSVVGKYYLSPGFNTLIAPSTVNSTVPQVTSPHPLAFRMHNPLFPRTCARYVLFAQQAHLAAEHGEADKQQAPVLAAKVCYSIGRGCAKKMRCARRIVIA
jgi:hypothetical protein